MSLPTVGLWRRNFCERGLGGLVDAPRSGRPRQIDDDEVQRVLAKDARAAAGRDDALERAAARGCDRDLADDGPPDLA